MRLASRTWQTFGGGCWRDGTLPEATPLRLLTDENLNGDLTRGLLLRSSSLDLVRVQDVGLSGASDDEVLSWAAETRRVLLTHDRNTMTKAAYDRVRAKLPMPGVVVVVDSHPLGDLIEEIVLMAAFGDRADCADRILFL